MPRAPLHVFPTPDALGAYVADHLLSRIAAAQGEGRRFLLGVPTGRSPRPVFAAMAERLARQPQSLAHVTLVMMDEYLVEGADGLQYAPDDAPWSCHYFGRVEIVDKLNAHLRMSDQLQPSQVWFPLTERPTEYDARIAAAGGIDCFLLASGASDGHVAFNPPGSARDSRTRIIPLSEETRRDNLQTFPSFGTLETVPHHGVSVGVATIAESREAIMLAWGAGKRQTVARMRAANCHEPDWPATLIHECAVAQIVVDAAAAG